MSERPFFSPADLGQYTLTETQVNKEIAFTSVAGVFLPSPAVRVYSKERGDAGRSLVATYEIGTGLALTGTNLAGQTKTLTLTLQGSLVSPFAYNDKIFAECELFTAGDVEASFTVIVK